MRTRLLVTVGVAAIIVSVATLPAHAQEGRNELVIRTVPRLAEVHFRIDDKRFESDASGIARATVSRSGQHVLSIRSPSLAGTQERVRFVAWSDGIRQRERSITIDGTTRIGVGIDVDYLVDEELRDARGDAVDAELLDSITVVDEDGAIKTLPAQTTGLAGPTALSWQRRPAGTRWLPGTVVTATPDGLKPHELRYEASGASAPAGAFTASAAPFYPARADTWTISLDAFRETLDAQGLFMGGPSDAAITVAGEGDEITAADGETVLLGPGDYMAKANAGGVARGNSFSVPGSPFVGVTVIGWLDVLILLLLLGGIVAAALLAGRRLRSGDGLRPRRIPALTMAKRASLPKTRRPVSTNGASSAPTSVRASGDAAPVENKATPPPLEPESTHVSPKELVKVRLHSGRIVEGWVAVGYEDKRVLIIDVMNVRDEDGAATAPAPQDRFIARHLVRDIERREAVPPKATGADGGSALSEPVA